MNLPIDTAYFAYLSLQAHTEPMDSEHTEAVDDRQIMFGHEELKNVCNNINDYLSSNGGVEICLRHHFSPNELCASALFIAHVPSLLVTENINSIIIRDPNKTSWCQQFISLGETNLRGGAVSLFHGAHVSHFKKTTYPSVWSALMKERYPLNIVTGVITIDIYFRKMLLSFVRYNKVYETEC